MLNLVMVKMVNIIAVTACWHCHCEATATEKINIQTISPHVSTSQQSCLSNWTLSKGRYELVEEVSTIFTTLLHKVIWTQETSLTLQQKMLQVSSDVHPLCWLFFVHVNCCLGHKAFLFTVVLPFSELFCERISNMGKQEVVYQN